MSRWAILGLIVCLVLAGVWLWWPSYAPPDRSSDLGTALVGGGIIAVAILSLERRYAVEADRRDLLLTLGLGETFVGIDLRDRDLSRAYLVGKDFSGARFDGVRLVESDLAGANLTRASLTSADLRGINFRGHPPPLYPSENLYPSKNLYPSSGAPGGTQQVGDATLDKVGLKDATYDDSTRWPEDFPLNETGAVHVNKRSLWWHFRRLIGRGS